MCLRKRATLTLPPSRLRQPTKQTEPVATAPGTCAMAANHTTPNCSSSLTAKPIQSSTPSREPKGSTLEHGKTRGRALLSLRSCRPMPVARQDFSTRNHPLLGPGAHMSGRESGSPVRRENEHGLFRFLHLERSFAGKNLLRKRISLQTRLLTSTFPKRV